MKRHFGRQVILGALTVAYVATALGQATPSPFTSGIRYNDRGLVVGTLAPDPDGAGPLRFAAVRNTYDSAARLVVVEEGELASWQSEAVAPASWSGFAILKRIDRAYDASDRIIKKSLSSAGTTYAVTQFSYDNIGRLECTAIRMNAAVFNSLPTSACVLSTQGSQGPDRITRLVYDAAGQVLNKQRAYGTSIQQNFATYAYTANARADWVEDANGNRTDFTYDGFDRLSRMNFPQTGVGAHAASTTDYEQYGYDNNGNRTSKRLRSGETISYQFDARNRASFKDLPGSSSDVTYTHDNFGLIQTAQISGGAGISNTFNGFGHLVNTTSTSSTGSLQLSYLYDEEGNRTRVTWPDGTYVQYTHDGLNRMKQARENGAASGPGLLADYSYDVFGRRANTNRGNGAMTVFYYDGASRLSNLTQDLASTSGDLSLGFSYNSASQVTQRTLSNDAYSYFPPTQSKSYARDGLNRYQAVGGVTLGYDGRGNLTSDGSRTFTYDLENHLLSVEGGAAPVSLTYDPDGRLLTSTSSGVTTRYLYDGDKMVAEYVGSTLVRRYVHGAGVDEPLVWYEGDALTDRRWLHSDHQGSVIASSDGSGVGTVYAYGPYGEPAYDNWSGSRFRYTGQMMLPEAKLYHYKARVYDPVLGRFLQTDPVGYDDDFNLYSYVKNDPLNSTDPTGQWAGVDDLIFAGGGALVGVAAQGFADIVTGSYSGGQAYFTAALGGAVAGETLLYTGNPILAGGAGALTTNLANQAIDNIQGEISGFDGMSAARDTAIGAATGVIKGDKIPGISSGRGNWAGLFKQMTTKLKNGTIDSVRPSTAAKMLTGAAAETALIPGSALGATASKALGSSPDATPPPAAPGPLPQQPLPCGSPNTMGCER